MMTRFTAGVVLLSWAACAAYPLGLLLAATPADFAFLRTAFGAMGCGITEWHPPLTTPGQVQRLGLVLGLVGLGLAGPGLALLRAGWPQRHQLPREWALARRRVRRAWGRLGVGQRRSVVAGLLALLGLRLLLSWWLAPDDDACSYRLFVRQPLLLISSCYPIPNNHVLTNSISRVFYLLHPGFWWSMRLPVLLVGAGGTVGWYLLLLVRTNFRVAALAVGLFSGLQLSLFVAAEGRGYALLFALSGLGFDSALTLMAPAGGRRRQLPWLALAVLGPLGLYTVPTFGYFLFSVYSWLAGWWLLRRAWRPLAQLAVLVGGTLLATTLLYAPLLLVSGFEALGHNRYLRPTLDAAAYWRSLPAELWVMEGRLATEKHVGGGLVLAVGLASAYLVRRNWHQAGRRLTAAAGLRLLALWCITSPYLLMVVQQVRAPERTLLYKSQFFFLLLALVAEQLPAGGRAAPWWWRHWVWLVLGGWLVLQLVLLYRFNESIRAYGEPAGLAATTPASAPSAVTFATLSLRMSTLVQATAAFIEEKFQAEGSGHDWPHIRRVWRVARALGAQTPGLDLEVVELAALLHDIADWKFHGGDYEAGPRAARAWLLSQQVPEATVARVEQVIREVSFKGLGVETPVTSPEAAVVQDADRLDAIGAIGVARAFAYGGHKGRPMHEPATPPVSHHDFEHYKQSTAPTINHFYEKLLHLKDRLHTPAARQLAARRHQFMEEFVAQFLAEWDSADMDLGGPTVVA